MRKLLFNAAWLVPLIAILATAIYFPFPTDCGPFCTWVRKTLNDPTAVFNCILAYFLWIQLLLLNRQEGLLRRSVDVAARAAEASMLQAKAAVGMELPVLRLVIPDELLSLAEPLPENGPWNGAVNDGVPTECSAIADFVYRNVGRTPAFPTKFAIGYRVASVLPDIPVYDKTLILPRARVITPGDEDGFRVDLALGMEFTEDELTSMDNGNAWLWVYGYIEYEDFLRDGLTTARFCLRWENVNAGQDFPFYAFTNEGTPPSAYILQTKVAFQR